MKFIINFIRVIIGLYLVFLIVIVVLKFTDKKLGREYSSIAGYSYFVVEDNKLEPDIPKSTLVILKADEYQCTPKEGDYVLFQEDYKMVLKKIIKENTSEQQLDEYLVGYPSENESDYVSIKKSMVLFKSIYYSDWLTICYHIFTNWIVVLVLVLFLALSPSITYKRFEL